jgi:hypothetical protein
MFGLRLLGFLQSDLDILLLIESQYQSTRLLLNLQKSNRANNKGLFIDYENTNNTDSNMPSLNLQDNSEQLEEDDTETETYDVDDSAEYRFDTILIYYFIKFYSTSNFKEKRYHY